ncbi:NADH dehydrogenase [ubiquinone] 1 alpha subcomplex subunit 9, mitochondrial-like isoform X2 [Littorina saxatilis]|uniref:NADH dehydrogenase [ubiquinone] 1 alpha subcomplex subunit 9, mitochondrial n=1 Tax=Littorina saxatilis TaxID=31220 RepID=A0AAN9G7J2_9CAEN
MASIVAKSAAHIHRHAPQQMPRILATVVISKRHSSQDLPAMKRGRGGRSSFSGIVATVFGASGFVGRYVCNRLGKIGSQVVVPYRGDPYEVERLRLCGDLGQVLFFPYFLNDEEAVRKVMKYSNVVINLVGREWETRNYDFDAVHVEGARRIARLARESGVEKLIHFSSLNASPTPQPIYSKEGSKFLRSKWEGELAVREEFPAATIFRPADIYGQEDRFLRYYANFWRRAHGTIPLWKKGDATIKQPVYVQDVAQGVVNAIKDPMAVGQTYELVGPERYYLADLVDYFYRVMRFRNVKRSYLSPLFRMKAYAMNMAPAEPLYSAHKLEKEFVTDITTGCPTLEDLGVKLTRLEDRAPWELKPWRQGAYYEEYLGEFVDPIPPPTASVH